MDDPWDVKSVRQLGQYTSCMKINGVPLLPPLLSKECRKEMQYYKLLAKEVEKRISVLQPYIESDTDSSEDKTDASEIPKYDQDLENDDGQVDLDVEVGAYNKSKSLDKPPNSPAKTVLYNSSKIVDTAETTTSHFILDFSVNIDKTAHDIKGSKKIESTTTPIELPERDDNCVRNQEILAEAEQQKRNGKCKQQTENRVEEIVNFSFSLGRDKSIDLSYESFSQEGPPSLGCRSFTGSLNNIHIQSDKNVNTGPKLVRQSSYTILNPSPQLLAHLEVQSLSLGVDVSSISMSESLSNLSTPGKKRRSWDLESAKVKWSNMALELKEKNLVKHPSNSNKGQAMKNSASTTRAKSVAAARTKYASIYAKPTAKSEPIPKNKTTSPVRSAPSDKTIVLDEPMLLKNNKESKPAKSVKEPTSPKTVNQKKEAVEHVSTLTAKEPHKSTNHKKDLQYSHITSGLDTPSAKFKEGNQQVNAVKPPLISESEDPATKVRELYDKIQKQQHMQMASLVEKQKREQILLQQAFEEQNNLLFKQLKTICPKSPEGVKEAWVDKTEADRGPVSLSQLINSKTPEQTFDSPLSTTLVNSNKYINHCDSVLKRSKGISDSLKKLDNSQNGIKTKSPKTLLEGSHTRTSSPNRKSTPTSRRLNYDTSDCEQILTDRTNDTMADLNVTFPSDTEDCGPFSHRSINNHCYPDVTVIQNSSTPAQMTDSAIKCMEQTIQKSMNSSRVPCFRNMVPTPKQQAAASKIVAHAKGYLVRRLMKTARVQSTVQTIKDALLCALQLHQDREGIRGADVDLHRRLIQQITAACYNLHDTFIASTASERCAMIAADRSRRASLASRPSLRHNSDVMSKSHSGAFLPRPKRLSSSTSLMTQSNYETYSSEKGRARYMPSPRRRPWR